MLKRIAILILMKGLCAQDYDPNYVLVKLDQGVNKGEFRTVLDPS